MAQNNGKEKKEVKKEDILRYPYIYNEHFTEKKLINETERFVVSFMFQKLKCMGELKWDAAVFGQLPFGDDATGTFKVGKTKEIVKFTVSVEFDVDNETVLLTIKAKGIQDTRLIEHLTIKHGFIKWDDDSVAVPEFTEPKDADNRPPKELTKKVSNPVYRPQETPIIPPYLYGMGLWY